MLSDLKGITQKLQEAVALVSAPAPSKAERMAEIHEKLADAHREADAFTKALGAATFSDSDSDPANWHEDSVKVALYDLDKFQDEVNHLAGLPPAYITAQNTNDQEMRRKMLLPASAQQRFFQIIALAVNHIKEDLDMAEVHQAAANRKAHLESGGSREGPPQDGTRTQPVPSHEVGAPQVQPRQPQPVPTGRDKGPSGNVPETNPAVPPGSQPGHQQQHQK